MWRSVPICHLQGRRMRRDTVKRVLAWALLGVVPLVAILLMLDVARSSDSISADFHNEIYPQAKIMLAGANPYPSPESDLTDGGNFVWPPLAVLIAAPLTLLPTDAADVVAAVLGLIAFVAALWLV